MKSCHLWRRITIDSREESEGSIAEPLAEGSIAEVQTQIKVQTQINSYTEGVKINSKTCLSNLFAADVLLFFSNPEWVMHVL